MSKLSQIEATVCPHVVSIAYHDKYWLIVFEDNHVARMPCYVSWAICPDCKKLIAPSYQRYQLIELLPHGGQD
jgi:hypothetical protein